jgi:hypothetical protein
MPTKLSSTVVSRISEVPNPASVQIVHEFYQYMNENGSSEKHMTNELQVVLYLTGFLGMKTSLLDASRQNIVEFLDSKQKDASQDPDKRWITTWNNYLSTIKHFSLDGFTTNIERKNMGKHTFSRRQLSSENF